MADVEIRTAQQFLDTLEKLKNGEIGTTQEIFIIELMNDLDFEAEGIGYRTEPFEFGRQVAMNNAYTTLNGNGHSIKNLTFENEHCIIAGGIVSYRQYTVIKNLNFENIFYRPTLQDSGDNKFFHFKNVNGNNKYLLLNNVSFSIAQVAIDPSNSFEVALIIGITTTVENCSFYLKNFNFPSSGGINGNSIKNSNFLIEDSIIRAKLFYPSKMLNIGVVLKDCKIKVSSCVFLGDNGDNRDIKYNYLVFDSSCQVLAGNSTFSITTSSSSGQNNILAFDDEVFGPSLNTITFRYYTGQRLTKAQIQDKEYLQQIGWLP